MWLLALRKAAGVSIPRRRKLILTGSSDGVNSTISNYLGNDGVPGAFGSNLSTYFFIKKSDLAYC